MDKVQFKNSLNSFVQENQLVEEICKKIRELPLYQSLKLDVELTLYIAKCIENHVLKKTPEERKLLIIRIVNQIHPLNPDENKILEGQINFLSDNGKIKKQSQFKALSKFALGWFVKKFL